MFQVEQLSILIVSLIVLLIIFIGGRKVQHLIDSNERPSAFVTAIIQYVATMENFTVSNMDKKHGPKFAPYIGYLFIYILLSNWAGLFGLESPTSNLSVTLALGVITWVLIQAASIQTNGVGGFIKGFFEPFSFFVIPNLFGWVAPLISLSLRLFGNVLSGGIILGMLFAFGQWLSSFIPVIGGFNWVGTLLVPAISAYFDIFSGFLQAIIFISLTSIFVGVEYNG